MPKCFSASNKFVLEINDKLSSGVTGGFAQPEVHPNHQNRARSDLFEQANSDNYLEEKRKTNNLKNLIEVILQTN